MTPTTTTAHLFPRFRSWSTIASVPRPTPVHREITWINQPLAIVLAHVRSVAHGREDQTAESDPIVEVEHEFWGRQVCVRYILHEVPGGTQVTASIEGPRQSRLDPMAVLAVRFMSRRIATDLSTMRDDLE